MRRLLIIFVATALFASPAIAQPVHTTYLWHMHQPVYWPDRSTWTPARYEAAYETITLGHSQNDVFTIFNKDDRVAAYQYAPKNAVGSILDLPDAGAQVSFAGALIENIQSLAVAGWNGNRYAPNWYSDYRTARAWTTSGGNPRLDPVLVAAHHPIAPLMDENALRMDIEVAKVASGAAWGDTNYSKGYFPAEMCFSERMIPALVAEGIDWVIVGDTHIARACADYPYQASQDNCDPPNRADQQNPAQGFYQTQTISRGVTVKTPPPFGYRPHYARYVDPVTGQADSIVVVPAANAMGWNEGYGLYGTGEVDAVAGYNDPAHPMLILFAHDGDNAWSGGYSYYNENVTGFSHAAATQGYEPTTIQEYLDDHPVDPADVVHVEDGGWVNADGDFGSPQFINWNWPLVNASGAFDIPGGWAEDERNWAVLTAAQNRVETAEQMAGGAPDPAEVYAPTGAATSVEKAWHHLLSGYESGYMYYGSSLDMEIKATLAGNAAVHFADPLITGADATAPTVWIPQRLPWNPGGFGGGSLWGYPGGEGAQMVSDFWVWTFAYDVSGLARVELKYRIDGDGDNPMTGDDNETYAGGPGVGAWQTLAMSWRDFPDGNFLGDPGIDFTVLPDYIADQYHVQVVGLSDVLVDYYVEAEDSVGNIKRTPIQHVWVGQSNGGGGSAHVIDGELDDGLTPIASNGGLNLYADWDGEKLYVAMEGVGTSSNRDHFLLVGLELTPPVAACWGKSGTVAGRALFLGNEDSNNWCGWFDGGESVVTADVSSASGNTLEGLVTLESHLGAPLPAGVYLAATGYGSPDGGALEIQAPSGNADANVDDTEYVYFPLVVTGVGAGRAPSLPVLRAAYPNPFTAGTRIDIDVPGPQRIFAGIYDVRGRRLATLAEGFVVDGLQSYEWDGRDLRGRTLPSGVYFVRLSSKAGIQSRKIVLVR